MAITLDAIAAALAARPAVNIYKPSVTSEGATTWHSLWKVTGNPTAGASPPAFTAGSGYVPTRATTGAIGQANPSGNLYVAAINAITSTAGNLGFCDRMWACSGFDTTSTSAQNITTPGTLTAGRDPNSGLDVEPWIEIYGAPGATGATWTLTGTDSTGTTGRTWTYAHIANAETVGQMAPMTAGTAIGGCRVPASLTCSVSSGTAGDVGITLLRRLAYVPQPVANWGGSLDAFALGLPEVFDDACIAMFVQCTTTVTGIWMVQLSLADLTP